MKELGDGPGNACGHCTCEEEFGQIMPRFLPLSFPFRRSQSFTATLLLFLLFAGICKVCWYASNSRDTSKLQFYQTNGCSGSIGSENLRSQEGDGEVWGEEILAGFYQEGSIFSQAKAWKIFVERLRGLKTTHGILKRESNRSAQS